MEIFPLDAQLLCGMGSYLLRFGRLDLAARSYEMAVVHGRVDPTIWHLADLADVAVTCWSLVLQLTDETKQAEAVLESALADRPDSLRLRRQLIELYVKTGRERDALAQCKSLPEDMPFRDEMPSVVRGRTAGGSEEIGGRARASASRVSGRVPRSAVPALAGGGQLDLGKPHGRRGHCGASGSGTSRAIWKLPHFARQRPMRRPADQSMRRVDRPSSPGLPSMTPAPSIPSITPAI